MKGDRVTPTDRHYSLAPSPPAVDHTKCALRTQIRVKPLVLFTRVKIVSQDPLFLDFLRFSEVGSDLRGITWERGLYCGDKVFYALLRPFLVLQHLPHLACHRPNSFVIILYLTSWKVHKAYFIPHALHYETHLSFFLNILSQGKKIFMSFISDYTRTIIESIKIKRSKRLRWKKSHIVTLQSLRGEWANEKYM